MTALPSGLVVEIAWTDGSIPRTETYGPWNLDPAETWLMDPADPHTKGIPHFLRKWQEATGCEPQRVVLTLVQDPEDALEALRAAKEAK